MELRIIPTREFSVGSRLEGLGGLMSCLACPKVRTGKRSVWAGLPVAILPLKLDLAVGEDLGGVRDGKPQAERGTGVEGSQE